MMYIIYTYMNNVLLNNLYFKSNTCYTYNDVNQSHLKKAIFGKTLASHFDCYIKK